jgi:hypothetical protein
MLAINSNFRRLTLNLSGLTLLATSVFSSFATTANASQPGESFGWLASKVDYIRDASGCQTDEASIEYQLSYDNSKTRLPSFFGTWHVYIRDAAGEIELVRNYISTTTSSAVCFNPVTQSVQVVVNDSSQYHEFIGPSISADSGLSSMAGYHFRGYVHLDIKANNNNAYITGLSPNNLAIKANPVFFVETNREATAYNSPELEDIKVYAVNLDNNTYNTVVADANGSEGIREIDSMGSLSADGNYFWVYHQRYNATTFTEKPNTAYNWTFNSLPSSGAIKPLAFIYDTTRPETNAVESVKATTAPDNDNVSVLVRVGIKDKTSGLSTSTVLVTNTSGVVVAAVITPLAKQRDYLALNINLIVPDAQSLTFVNVVEDAAGNISTSTPVTQLIPATESLTFPTVINVTPLPPDNIQSTQLYLSSQVTNSGGSLVSARGSCWELNETSFTSATNTPRCRISYSSTAGFDNDVYTDTHTSLPASTTIYYRAFATNGSGTAFSPIVSVKTRSFAGEFYSDAVVPVLSLAYQASTSADSSRLGGKIDGSGGSRIFHRGVCWGLIATMLPTEAVDSPNCFVWNGSLPTNTSLPHWFDRVFYNLPFNTTIHYRAYASNAIGTSTRTASFSTDPARLDIAALDYTITNTAYNTASESYSITLPVIALDRSNYVIGYSATSNYPIKRTVPFTVFAEKLDGSLIASQSGFVTVPRDIFLSGEPVASIPSVTLTNIPFGFIQLRVVVNDGEPTYNESFGSTTAFTNNSPPAKIINLNDPKLEEDIITTSGGGFGPTLQNPNYEISFGSDVIRAGSQTLLYWDTKVNYSMSCEIKGPTTFGTNGVYTFDPSIDGVTGSVSTGVLSSAQVFRITCHEPITNTTYFTETRVDVIGALKEV